MRAALVVAVLAAALAGVAVAAGLEARHDDGRSARALEQAWRSVGGRVAGPELVSANADPRLTCFRYRLAAPRSRLSLCFDGAGRLLELARAEGDRLRLVSLSTNPGRATVRVEPAALRRARAGLLDSEASALRAALGRCGAAVSQGARARIEASCEALRALAAEVAGVTLDVPQLSVAASTLTHRANAIVHTARGRRAAPADTRRLLERERARAAAVVATFERDERAARARLAGG